MFPTKQYKSTNPYSTPQPYQQQRQPQYQPQIQPQIQPQSTQQSTQQHHNLSQQQQHHNLSQQPQQQPRHSFSQQPQRGNYKNNEMSLGKESSCSFTNDPQTILTYNSDAPTEYSHNVRNEPSQYLEDDSAPMTYPDVYAPREFLQSPQLNLISNPSWFLSIDSSDRDRSKYPNPFKYTIHMTGTSDNSNVTGHRYKNVHSIELISAILPNVDEIKDEQYIILDIEELEDIGFDSSNQNLKGAYAKLVLDSHINQNFLLLDADNSRPLQRIYYPAPKASVDRLTITLKKPNGDIINLGPDNDPDLPPLKEIQNSFTFKIITKITDASVLGHRNV